MKDETENKQPLEIEDGGKEEKDRGSTGPALGLCFGSALGLLVYVVTGDIIWFPIWVAIGCGLGFATGDSGKHKK